MLFALSKTLFWGVGVGGGGRGEGGRGKREGRGWREVNVTNKYK